MQPPRGPAFARLRRAWFDDEIDTDTYWQFNRSNEDTIAAALESLQISTYSIHPESQTDEDDGYLHFLYLFSFFLYAKMLK